MSKEIAIGILLTALVAGGLAYWYYGPWPLGAPEETVQDAGSPLPASAPDDETAQYPAPAPAFDASEQAPLPELAGSDALFRETLEPLFGEPALTAYLAPDNLIARLVSTIDSLDRAPVPLRTRVIAPVPEALVVETSNGETVLSPKNSARYRVAMASLQAVDGASLAQLYLRYYPLFQQAYVELGFPKGHFNDRLVKIIDHLLATPDLKTPPALVRPALVYKFADPELEGRSSGQKILLRMGPQHASTIKNKLREIRAVIAAAPEPAGAD